MGDELSSGKSATSVRVSGQPYREPLHASITVEKISDLVDQFYGKVQQNERLGPIFEQRVAGNWGPHLAKMKGFWRSVLLKTAEYDGRPMPVHARIGGLTENDFRIWLRLFRATVGEIFEAQAQPIVIELAERIASSFYIGINGDLLAKPPNWAEGG